MQGAAVSKHVSCGGAEDEMQVFPHIGHRALNKLLIYYAASALARPIA